MNILFVMPTHISYGGIESITLNLWRALIKKGHSVSFVCHGNEIGLFEHEILNCGSEVYHIPVKSKNIKESIKSFSDILKHNNVDVVHAHMNATCGIYLKVAEKCGVKVLVAHSHASSIFAITRNPIKIVINVLSKRYTNKYANIRVACSDKAGRWLFGKNPYNVILNAINVEQFYYSESIRRLKRKELDILDNELVICHVGGFFKCKNHKKLLDIFKEIKKLNQNSSLILVGDGPLRIDIEHKIKKLRLENSIKVLGARRDINEILQAADIFLLPSFSEGNPVVLMEAATTGLHCLVSNCISKDSACFFQDGNIEFLPIRGKESSMIWAKKAVLPRKRIIYSHTNSIKLTSDYMAEKIEQLYFNVLWRN